MPNSEPSAIEYAVGTRQKRMENLSALVEFLRDWKKSDSFRASQQNKIAERFCDMNFQYGHVTKKDIVEQALMKANLL
jgi:hypothetical protein